MSKMILFVLLPQYADWEAAYLSSAIKMLGQDAYEIKTVSLTKDPVLSIGGFHTLPDYDLAAVPPDYEAAILIGGMTWRTEAAQAVKPLIKRCRESGKVLAGICDAAAFLGTAGALNDVAHTSNDLTDLKRWAGKAYFGEAKYLARQAVRDGTVVTANGTAPMEFAKEVLLALGDVSEEKIQEWYHFHKLGFYTAPMSGV